MKFFAFFLSISIVFSLFSCQLEEPEGDVVTLLAGENLVAWRVAAGKVKIEGAEIDVVGAQNPCVLDNQVILYADGRFELSEGQSTCQAGDPALIYSGRWSYNPESRAMTIDRFTFLSIVIEQPTFTIQQINEDSFTGTTQVTFQGETVQAEISFSRVK